MKFIVAFLLTALLGYAAGFYFPWWSIAIAAFIVAVAIPQKPLKAFLSGFLSLFVLWVVLALYIDMENQHILKELGFEEGTGMLNYYFYKWKIKALKSPQVATILM